jgi:hypothetical protein
LGTDGEGNYLKVQSLGLTMIVKDEPSERVAALVDFMSPLLSQAVILDTGSALYDEDLRKSKTWDFKVEYDQIPWQPDFSVMRNQSLERLNTDWALALDADEIVSLGLAAAIKRVLEDCAPETLGWLVFTKNFWGGERGISVEEHWHCRLFRTKSAKYYKPVHEQVMLNGRQEASTRGSQTLPKMNDHDYLIHAKPQAKLDESARVYQQIEGR